MSPRNVVIILLAALLGLAGPAVADETDKADASRLTADAQTALARLSTSVPLAKSLVPKAHAILVFPKVTKAGFVVGGQHGEGVLLQKGKAVAYYKTTGGSVGLQAGGQTYGYAMFFMSPHALAQLDDADGFEVGVGPSVVVVDEGMGRNVTTTTSKADIYAFVFGQKGLMAGLGIQGNKIGRFKPE